jgi:hypothetical protein
MDALTTVIAPATLIGALVFYIGWTRTRALWSYFGIDNSVLHLSSQDYVLRSTNAIFPALAVLALLTAGAFWMIVVGKLAMEKLEQRYPTHAASVMKWIRGGVGLMGATLSVVGTAGLFHAALAILVVSPVLLGIGALLLLAAGPMRYRQQLESTSSRFAKSQRTAATLSVGALWVVAILATFWGVSDFALLVGRGSASLIADNLHLRPEVTILSAESLALEGPAVQAESLQSGQQYAYRYSGLRLLIKTEDEYFLLPSNWTRGENVLVVKESPSLRFEFSSPVTDD